MGLLSPLARELLTGLGVEKPGPWEVGLISAAMVLIGTLAAAWLLTAVVTRVLRRVAARTETDIDDKIIEIIENPLRRLVLLGGMFEVVYDLPLDPRVQTIVSGVLLVLVVWVAVRVVTRVGLVLLGAYARRVESERFQKDYYPLLSKVVGTVLGIVGLIVILDHFGQDVSSLVAALGIGGVAVSLAAKDTLGSMIAGFIILVDRPFRPGDRIKLASGELGDVVEIGTRSTRVKLLDQNLLIVPNNELVNSRVVNFNFPAHSTGVTVDIRLPYGTDVDKAKAITAEVLAGDAEVTRPAPAPVVSAFTPEALVVTVTFTVADYTLATPVGDRVRTEIHRRLYAAGMRMAIPVREIVQAKA